MPGLLADYFVLSEIWDVIFKKVDLWRTSTESKKGILYFVLLFSVDMTRG